MIKVRCPNCREESDLPIDKLPIYRELKCLNPECGVILKIQVAFVAPQPKKPTAQRVMLAA